jgi:hypothetical protein
LVPLLWGTAQVYSSIILRRKKKDKKRKSALAARVSRETCIRGSACGEHQNKKSALAARVALGSLLA